MNKLIRNGMVGVIYSPGFGAGWSTWNREYPEIVFDPMIITFIEKQEIDKIKTYIAVKYPDLYASDLEDLQVAWLPEGTLFRIHEYDGNESVEVKEKLDWLIA